MFVYVMRTMRPEKHINQSNSCKYILLRVNKWHIGTVADWALDMFVKKAVVLHHTSLPFLFIP